MSDIIPNFGIDWSPLTDLPDFEMDEEFENTLLQIDALGIPINLPNDPGTQNTVAEINLPPQHEPIMPVPDTNIVYTVAEIHPPPLDSTTPTQDQVTAAQIHVPTADVNMPEEHVSNVQNVNLEEIQKFIESNDNKNTSKKTLYDVKLVQHHLKKKNENREIQEIPSEELDSLLADFLINARKKDGKEYEPSSLRGIISSLDRKLRRHRYGHYICGDKTDTKFPLTKETLKTKLKVLKKQGKGNRPNRAQPMTDAELNSLYEQNLLGGTTPESLLNTIWFNNSIHFGLRGVQEHYQLRWVFYCVILSLVYVCISLFYCATICLCTFRHLFQDLYCHFIFFVTIYPLLRVSYMINLV